MTKTPPDMFKAEYEGEVRAAWLLTGNLQYLMALEANGLDRCAAALLERIDAGLRRKPAEAKPEPAGRVSLPDEERGRSAYDLERLDRINARLIRGYKDQRGKTATEQREEDLQRREALEREISDRAEKAADARRHAEAEALALARGEEVTTDRSGVRRILAHDPIASLTWLSNDQDAAAKAIRDAYELRGSGAGVLDYEAVRGGSHDNDRFTWRGLDKAKAAMLIGQVATGILVGTFRSQRGSLILVRTHARFEAEAVIPTIAWAMIQAVCGQGLTLTSQGAGRAYDRNRRALALGLDVAHEVMSG